MRNGLPVEELTPVQPRHYVSAEAAIATFTSAARLDATRFRSDLDAILGQDPAPRA